MKDQLLFLSRLRQENFELGDKLVSHAKIQWAKICEKWFINEIFVDVEKVSIRVILWRLLVGYPIKSVFNDLNCLAHAVRGI